jgi:hypothetical protein
MSIIIYKWFWAWNFDKEEKWLNEMSEKGLQLTDVKAIRYKFDEGKTNEYTYRIELLDNLPSSKKSRDYLRFLEETGVEMIGSYLRWVYLRKKKSEGDFDLFSDLDSRISHLTRILYFLAVFIPIELLCAVDLWCSFTIHAEAYNLIVALLSSVLEVLIIIGVFRIYKERKRLKVERCLHE